MLSRPTPSSQAPNLYWSIHSLFRWPETFLAGKKLLVNIKRMSVHSDSGYGRLIRHPAAQAALTVLRCAIIEIDEATTSTFCHARAG